MAVCLFALFIWELNSARSINTRLILIIIIAMSLTYDLYWIIFFKFDWLDNYGPEASMVWKRLKIVRRILFCISIALAGIKVRSKKPGCRFGFGLAF